MLCESTGGQEMSNATALCNEIEQAFSSIRRPKKILPIDNSLEGQRAAAFFDRFTWKEVTFELLRREYVGDISVCLSFLRADAGLYFLPSYLLIAIRDFHESDMVPNVLERQLSSLPEQSRNYMKIISNLSALQLRAVAKTLQFLSLEYERDYEPSGAERALLSGWNRYLPDDN